MSNQGGMANSSAHYDETTDRTSATINQVPNNSSNLPESVTRPMSRNKFLLAAATILCAIWGNETVNAALEIAETYLEALLQNLIGTESQIAIMDDDMMRMEGPVYGLTMEDVEQIRGESWYTRSSAEDILERLWEIGVFG